MKIVELLLDDLEGISGLDAISLVERPAHESNWLAFAEENKKNPYDVLSAEQLYELAIELNKLGEPVGKLESEGWKLEKIEPISSPLQFAINIISTPNEESGEDSELAYRIRYKYTGPRDNKNRAFCSEMMRQNRVFRREDIDAMTEAVSNPEFGFYSIWDFRGSFNCRHYWTQLTYKYEGEIINKSTNKTGVKSTDRIVQEPTITTATANAQERREKEKQARKIQTSAERFNVIDVVDGMPLFDNEDEALQMAEIIGCSGSHTHQMEDGTMGYMPCERHEFETYDDYPQDASESACKVLKWIDEHGRDEVSGMELSGLARANQLCKREPLSRDTIARMAAFERHRKNSKISPEFEGTPWKDKGYVAWLAWGNTSGIEWAQRKLEELEEEKFLYENPCQTGYIAYGTKIKDGKKVPNCVEMNKENVDGAAQPLASKIPSSGTTSQIVPFSKQSFSVDDEKMRITGAAIIPNKMIVRRSQPTADKPQGEFYYVFFSEETTRKLAQKFIAKDKLLDATNIEHIDHLRADSYVIESWIVEDSTYDKSAALGLEYPKGTWVITMQVENPSIWKRIKEGKLNGFSIQGWFAENLLFN